MLNPEQILEIARAHCFYPDSDLTALVRAVEKTAEAAAIERCAKALYGRLMRQDVGFEEAHLSLNVGGVPPTEHEFVEAIRALLPKEE